MQKLKSEVVMTLSLQHFTGSFARTSETFNNSFVFCYWFRNGRTMFNCDEMRRLGVGL